MVLQIYPDLIQRLQVAGSQRQRAAIDAGANRVGPVDRVIVAAIAIHFIIAMAVAVIQPAQHGVFHFAGIEQALQLVIHAKLVGHLRFMLRHAGDGVVVDLRVYVINQILIVFIAVGEAQVLGKRQRIAEVVLEAVTDRRLFAPRFVEAGLADVEVIGHIARAGREQRAGARQEVARPGFRIVLVAGQQRKAGVFVRQPGEGRGDGYPLLLAVFDKLVFGSGDTVQAIEQGVVVVELAAEIERRFRQMCH